jgi:S-formylglutathione hydrolase
MATLEQLEVHESFGGKQFVYRHRSVSTGTPMTFSVYLPPQAAVPAASGEATRLPVVWYLSGLTCTHANVTEKGEFRRACAELGLIFIAPDTSPRGTDVAGDPENAYDFGLGAGFYVDATVMPFAAHYRMYGYVTKELPELVATHLPVDLTRQVIMGHSMGGHGALTIALKNPGRYRAVSAFAPIVAPSQVPWGVKAFTGYLGTERSDWARYDACSLIESGYRVPDILVDQGGADPFLQTQLQPERLRSVCDAAGQKLTLRIQPGYDHSYYFIATFMEEHLRWHAARLR